jgi:hypothetical protein
MVVLALILFGMMYGMYKYIPQLFSSFPVDTQNLFKNMFSVIGG